MIHFIIIFLVFAVIARRNAKKKGLLSPSGWLLYIYTFSAFCAILLLIILPHNRYAMALDAHYAIPSFVLLLFLLAFFFPFISFNEHETKALRLPSKHMLDIFSNIIIALSLFSIFFYSVAVRKVFALDLGEARNARYATNAEEMFEVGIQNTIASVSASFYVFAIMLFFIYLIIGKSRNRCILLFISSFSEAMHVLAYVGRDGVVFWIFTFIFEYCLFKDYLNSDLKKKIRRYGLIVMGIILVPFMLITMGRFSGNENVAMLDYMGQPLINGTLFMGMDNQPRNPGYGFPLFFEVFGGHHPQKLAWAAGGTESQYFMTFVYGMILSLGYLGAIVVCIGVGLFFVHTFGKRKTVLPFYKLFIYLLYFQVFSQGVFYFRHYTRGGNFFIVLSLLFAMAFYQIQTSSKNMTFTKIGTAK